MHIYGVVKVVSCGHYLQLIMLRCGAFFSLFVFLWEKKRESLVVWTILPKEGGDLPPSRQCFLFFSQPLSYRAFVSSRLNRWWLIFPKFCWAMVVLLFYFFLSFFWFLAGRFNSRSPVGGVAGFLSRWRCVFGRIFKCFFLRIWSQFYAYPSTSAWHAPLSRVSRRLPPLPP
jgi:hypothetical protein